MMSNITVILVTDTDIPISYVGFTNGDWIVFSQEQADEWEDKIAKEEERVKTLSLGGNIPANTQIANLCAVRERQTFFGTDEFEPNEPRVDHRVKGCADVHSDE